MDQNELNLLSKEHPIVFYDGVCNLCDGFVNFVIRNDPQGKIKFCALQDEQAVQIRKEARIEDNIDTVVGLHNEKIHTHSDVLFLVAEKLGGYWLFILPLQYFHKGFRDLIYRWVARNRYNWFGKRETCIIPSSDLTARFL
ncbi:MAG: putative DCC family thiol-disulfide oxidoreductase YuxK [Saprospiraceae bacterium]|jgi:predicted DCC family thiol-disulfide oxidoreductase YuxK